MPDEYDELIRGVVGRSPRRPPSYNTESALDLIAQHESGNRDIKQQAVPAGGGYNPSVGRVTGPSSASGPWQITNSTWRKRAPQDIAQKYPTAMSAPVEVQRTVARKIFSETGFQDWAPYNARLRQAIARGEQPQSQGSHPDDEYSQLIRETVGPRDEYSEVINQATAESPQGRGAPAQPVTPIHRRPQPSTSSIPGMGAMKSFRRQQSQPSFPQGTVRGVATSANPALVGRQGGPRSVVELPEPGFAGNPLMPVNRAQARAEGEARAQADAAQAQKVRNVVRATAPPGFSLLPESTQEWIGGGVAKAAGGLASQAAGVVRSGGIPALDVLQRLTGKRIKVTNDAADKISRAATELQSGAASMDRQAARGGLSQAAQDVLAGSVSSAPAMALVTLGVPAPVAFGLQSYLEAEGRDAEFKEILGETAKGATIGALFELPLPAKQGLINAIGQRATKAGLVGGGTFVLDKLAGSENDAAAQNALINAAFAASGDGKREGVKSEQRRIADQSDASNRAPIRARTGTSIPQADTPSSRASYTETSTVAGVKPNETQIETQPNIETQLEGAKSADVLQRRMSEPERMAGIQNVGDSNLAQGQAAEPVRHVDLQRRVKRGPNKGNFAKESRAEKESRRQQVEQAGQPNQPLTQPPVSAETSVEGAPQARSTPSIPSPATEIPASMSRRPRTEIAAELAAVEQQALQANDQIRKAASIPLSNDPAIRKIQEESNARNVQNAEDLNFKVRQLRQELEGGRPGYKTPEERNQSVADIADRLKKDIAEVTPEDMVELRREESERAGVSVPEPWQQTQSQFLTDQARRSSEMPEQPSAGRYVDQILNWAGNGESGLSETVNQHGRFIVYRDSPSGVPIAAAKLSTDGKSVEGFAADKSRGLLSGRAAIKVGQELERLGADSSSTTMTEDAARLVHHRAVMKAVKSGKEVPADVLADYPDLSPQPETKPVVASGPTAPREAGRVDPQEPPKPTQVGDVGQSKPPEYKPKERSLPKTMEAAGVTGEKLTYEPESFSEGRASDEGRRVVEEKGVDGAIEHVLHGEPDINWASTGFATLEKLNQERSRLRGAGDLEGEAAIDSKYRTFRREFAERATKLGQGIVGIKAIEDFAAEDASYTANKLSQKGRKRDLTPKEDQRISEVGERLQSVAQRKKINDAAWAEAQGRVGKKAGASERPKTYRDRLDEQAESIKLTLKPKVGKFDFGRIGTTTKSSERGAARTPSAPLENDAELLAQYTASRLSKVNTVAELNTELLAEFGKEIEPHLSAIRQRAYEIQLEARKAELVARETQPVRRRTILSEIQSEIAAARKEARMTEKERRNREEEIQSQKEREYQAKIKNASREERIKARAEFETAKAAESKARSEVTNEARVRVKQLREEYKEASKAEKSGWRQSIRAQKEAAKTAQLWDTPIRKMAEESRARLSNADSASPDVFNDLVNVATAKLLPTKPGGIGRYRPLAPAEFYASLKAEFPDLVTRKNQGKIYKEAYQRIQDVTSAAREATKLRVASKEAKKFWDEMGLDVDAQTVLIQRAEILRQQQQARADMAREFRRVSRPLWKKIPFEFQAGFRALKSSVDAPLGRQGIYYLITHPIMSGRYAIPATLKGYTAFRRGTFRERVAEQQSHPDYSLAMKSGVGLTDVASHGDPRIQAEELFQSAIAERIPHVRLSEQGFVLGMNEMRLQAFSRFADIGRANGYTFETHPEFFKEMANRVNNATGRGTLSAKQQTIASGLNQVLYSTRLNVSRVQLLNDLFNPAKYIKADPVTRKIMATEVLRLAVGMGAIYGGAKALGVGISIDPDDPDFGKLRIGKTHYDVTGGEAGTIRFLYRFLRGVTKLGLGQAGFDTPVAQQENPYEVAKNFARQKLAPVPGTAVDFLAGKDLTGRPKTLSFKGITTDPARVAQENILLNIWAPMVVGDFIDAAQEEGLLGVAKTTPALAGFGVQSYVPTREVAEVRRKADEENQRKRKWAKTHEEDYPNEDQRSELSKAAAELNRMSSEAKKATTVKDRDIILHDMKTRARQVLPPRYLSQ